MNKPYSQACRNNSAPIASVLKRIFNSAGSILEIGSGTGQHACYFSSELQHLFWQPSDLPQNLPGIRLWCEGPGKENIMPPIKFNVAEDDWPAGAFDGVFSANTAHIMSAPCTAAMMSQVGKNLCYDGFFCLYGPFNYQGNYTSDSNLAFDQWLKRQNPEQGIRDFEWLQECAAKVGLILFEDNEMPANNRLLVWKKAQR